MILVLSGSQLDQLLDYFGIATWVMYGAVAVALMKLRSDDPHLHRPFMTRFYPLPPLIVVVSAV